MAMKQYLSLLHFGSTRPENSAAGSTPHSSLTAYHVERSIWEVLLVNYNKTKSKYIENKLNHSVLRDVLSVMKI
jgi:hypothetical protein